MAATMSAQVAAYRKMSPLLREVVRGSQEMKSQARTEKNGTERERKSVQKANDSRRMFFLARISGNAEEVVRHYGGRLHAQLGGVSVVEMPVSRMADFSMEEQVVRMEASRKSTALLDTTSTVVDALPVYAGTNLPQPFTGSGVVMGVMDIGFDLTHPTFYNPSATNYRIKALWDQLDNGNVNDNDNSLPIGREYTDETALLAVGRSYDGIEQAHGTHTAGIAAGSGHDTPYRGLAWESDICLVANATTNNANLIPDSLLEMYNSTMDILGFKYIFDYAQKVGKPCVISFSEGSTEDLEGEDKLIYEALEELTGPGRILVASAGNTGERRHYFSKPRGTASVGSFVNRGDTLASYTLNTDAPFDLRMVVYSEHPDTIVYHLDSSDTEIADTLMLEDGEYVFQIAGNKSPYYDDETAYVVTVDAPHNVGFGTPLSVELIGEEANAEFYATRISLTTNSKNPALSAGDTSRGIHSPGSAPCVICVGANGYRAQVKNYNGQWYSYNGGVEGRIAPYSSLGPTFDRRIKPDVVAPGLVVSAFNSFNEEASPNSWSADRCTTHTEWNGRRYGWCVNIGTSMSTPVVGGAVALWLQANPSLTPEDVMDIIRQTSRQTDPSLTYPNNTYGYGEIDVYAGIVEALKRTTTGLADISNNQPQDLTFSLSEGLLTLFLQQATTQSVPLRVYSTSGALMMQQTIPAGCSTYQIDLSGLPRGIYAIQADGHQPSLRGSMLVRR